MLLQGRKNKILTNKYQSKNFLLLKTQSGQAVIEYVLLLVLSLLLLGGVIYQFNSAFRIFANSWFVGEESYIACAIRNGILPDGSDQEEVCSRPRFDISKGQTKNGQGIGPNGEPLDQNRATNDKNKSAKAFSASTSSGGRRASDQGIGVVPFNNADAKNAGLKNLDSKKTDGEKSYTGSSGVSSSNKFQDFEAQEQGRDKNRFGRKSAPTTSEEVVQSQNQTVPLSMRDLKTARELAAEKKKKEKSNEASVELSFGNVFKYIIIALLVFSIVFFLGSQFMAVARSKKRK